MMELKKPNELQSAFIFVKCSKTTHDDCRQIRDAMIDETGKHIQEAYTTDAYVDGVTWCVVASALLTLDESKNFEKTLKNITTGGKNPITIKNMKFLMNRQ